MTSNFWWQSASGGGYQINNSLRFNSADSAHLKRTPASAGNRKTWTWSAWVKRGTLGSSQNLFGSFVSSTSDTILIFNSDNTLRWGSYYSGSAKYTTSTQVFRDPSAWYHIVWAVDTTQATATDRMKVYVNGSQITSYSGTSVGQNADLDVNNTTEHWIGVKSFTTGSREFYFDGYIAEVNFIDGSALDHEDFGELDDNGVWRPIKYAGSYTGNSFYLKFASGDGTDSSGLSNTWTANNFTTSGTGTDVMSDTPTTNWCTLNPVGTTAGFIAPTDGNLKTDSGTYSRSTEGTFGIPKDGNLYYFEGTMTRDVGDGGTGLTFGVHTQGHTIEPDLSNGKGFVVYGTDGGSYDGALFAYQYDGNNLSPAVGGHIYSGTNLAFAIKYDSGTWSWYYRQGSNGWYHNTGSAWEYNSTFDETEPTATYSSVPENETLVPIGNNVIFNFGQRDFAFTPPTGAKLLRSSDLPAPDIADGSDYFNTVLYTGNNSSTRSITGVGFEPDLVWIKARFTNGNNVSHVLTDQVRGAGKTLKSHVPAAEITNGDYGYLSSFDTDGFTLTRGSISGEEVNNSPLTYVAWNWDAGGSGSSNTAGSITSTVSANPSAGFSIVSYTGTFAADTIGHGLGVAPNMIITKDRDVADRWQVYHSALGNGYTLRLEESTAAGADSGAWNSTSPTSTVFSVGASVRTNRSGSNFIAYCFAEVEGYSKFGGYSGGDGVFVYLGFRPALLITKGTLGTRNWNIHDSTRSTYNVVDDLIHPNLANAEGVSGSSSFDFVSNGFVTRGGNISGSGDLTIFAAFAENPFGGSGVSPATAR